MSITICVLFAAIIKRSTAETHLNPFTKAKGGDRSLLQTPEPTLRPTLRPILVVSQPTKAPIQIYDDLSVCDYEFDMYIPATEEEETNYWFTIDSSRNSIIGIDACDYEQARNDFYFRIYLYQYGNNYEYYSYTSSGNNPSYCTVNGNGAYLEYDTQWNGYTTNWWFRVVIYSSSNSNRRLQLTRRCEIKPTTPAPISPMPTTLFCGSRIQTTVQAGNILPHYYLLNLNEPMKVHFQDCETEFDPNLFVYDSLDRETMEELNSVTCNGDDCGDCSAYTDSETRENYALNLNAGQYFVMIQICCDNSDQPDATGEQYVLEITCEEATSPPTTPEPTPYPTPYPSPYPTTEMPSRSPLFPGETHPPTTAMPTTPPTTKRPSRSPTTKTPSGSPTTEAPIHGEPAGAVNYSVIGILFVGIVIGILFV